MECCPFCSESLSNGELTNKLTQKGCDRIQKASRERGFTLSVSLDQLVHTKCRSDFTNTKSIENYKKRKLETDENGNSKQKLRSEQSPFSYKDHCLFCTCGDPYNGKKLESKLVRVRSFKYQKKILECCDKFPSEWSDAIKGRILFVHDLPAAAAVYHKICDVNFRTGRHIPGIFNNDEQNDVKCNELSYTGRPKDQIKSDAFNGVTKFLEEHEDEQITISDVIGKMQEFLSDPSIEPYSSPHMKRELKNHFGERIFIADIDGKPNLVTFHTKASKILYEFHSHNEDSKLDGKKSVIDAAADLIKQDISNVVQNKDVYPTVDDLSAENAFSYIPLSLQNLLKTIICGKDSLTKIASIGQCIMQAARPRKLLAPLQIGLGIQMHHQFQSKFLIDTLHHHGFTCSYSEVQLFERSAALVQGTEIPSMNHESCLQYAADNVDHNIQTIDGKGTFHGMGIIAMVTPGTNLTRIIPRAQVTTKDIIQVGKINIKRFVAHIGNLEPLRFQPITDPKVSKKPNRCWNIRDVRSHLGKDICENILFAHALLGCDTTSRIFGIGKIKAVSKLKCDPYFVEKAQDFMNQRSTQEDITKAGECALVCLYNGHQYESLDSLRLRKFMEKSTSSIKVVQPGTLPPTSDAARFHCLRVYQQTQVWLGNEDNVPPQLWGWNEHDGKLTPLLTDKLPAPHRFLEAIHCTCKTGCYTFRCSCKKNGLDCSTACRECRGVCGNSSKYDDISDSEDEQEIF